MNAFALMQGFLALRANGNKSRADVLALQEKKLRKLLFYAYDHSEYYRARFARAGIARTQLAFLPLGALPALDKRDLTAHFDELITVPGVTQAALRRFDEAEGPQQRTYRGCHVVHSSGSTGAPAYFLYDEPAWNAILSGILRGALWGMSLPEVLGLLAGRPRILYIAATNGRYGGAMAVGDGIDGVGARQLFLDINTPLHEWPGRIEAFRPNLVIGYPSAMKILADLVADGGLRLELRRAVTCGEPLSPGMRRYLEGVMHADVVNFYGAGESLALGVEGAGERGITLFDDLNVVEVVDGQMYLTCLYNFAQPLIRYRISDSLTLAEGAPGPFSHADLLLGRSEDMLWFEGEGGKRDFLHPLAVEGFCLEGLTDYQFVQRGRDGFTMLAVADRRWQIAICADIKAQMGRILREKRLDWVSFHLQFVDEIPPDARTGKKRLIVRAA